MTIIYKKFKNDYEIPKTFYIACIVFLIFEIIWFLWIFPLAPKKENNTTGTFYDIELKGIVNMDEFNQQYEIIEVKNNNVLYVIKKEQN